MNGVLGVGGDLTEWRSEEMEEARFWIEHYKKYRPLIQEGDLYRLRSPRRSNFSANLFLSPDASQGALFVFLSSSRLGADPPRLPLRGLSPEANYRVREIAFDRAKRTLSGTFTASGRTLLHRGLDLDLVGDYSSALIELEKVTQ